LTILEATSDNTCLFLREGRKLFYVSAFCESPPPERWHRQLYVVSDGGTCFWQAFYDPALKKYFHLTINR
jgi:hypothetical protein